MWQTLDTAGKITAIKTAWSPKTPIVVIASRIPGATKNAIVGIYGRNPDLRADYPLRKIYAPGVSTPKPKTERLFKPRRKPMDAPKPVFRIAEPHTAPLPLLGLSRHRCKWAVNDTTPYLFCADAAEGSYCEFHAGLSVGRGTESERTAHRLLRKEMVR